MVAGRRVVPHQLGSVRLVVASALVGTAFACNALLGNDPREFTPSHAPGGENGEGSSGTAGGAALGGGGHASAGKAGASPRPSGGNAGALGGASGEDNGAQATSGKSAAGNGGAAGEVGSAGSAGEAGAGAGGSAPDPCAPSTAECSKGAVEDAGSVPCGHCGTQAMTHSCSDTCTWSDPVPKGTCTDEGCAPTDTQTQTVSCPCGGSKSQIQTCSDACAWGPWMDTTQCDVSCCTTIVYCNTKASQVASEFPGRGTWCREETAACSDAEADADCLAAADTVCGGIEPNLYMEYH